MAKASSESKHRRKVEKRKAHKPEKGSGCVTRCQGSKYVENNEHSHRWNAAQQARDEKDVYEKRLKKDFNENANIKNWRARLLRLLKADQGLIGSTRKNPTNQMKPFYRMWWPFPHNAHHIIPMGVLWSKVIDVAVKKAKKNPTKMFNAVIDSFLTEPYNHNARFNMITLPTAKRESDLTGLPRHLKDKAFDHPDYTGPIASQVTAKIPDRYGDLATAADKAGHVSEEEFVTVFDDMKGIAEPTYKAIMALAEAKALAGQTLDEASDQIAQLAATFG